MICHVLSFYILFVLLDAKVTLFNMFDAHFTIESLFESRFLLLGYNKVMKPNATREIFQKEAFCASYAKRHSFDSWKMYKNTCDLTQINIDETILVGFWYIYVLTAAAYVLYFLFNFLVFVTCQEKRYYLTCYICFISLSFKIPNQKFSL